MGWPKGKPRKPVSDSIFGEESRPTDETNENSDTDSWHSRENDSEHQAENSR